MFALEYMLKVLSIVILCVLLTGCQGAQFPSMDQMVANMGSSLPGIWRLLTASSYLLGLVFIFRGVYQLKLYGDLRTMMSTQTNFKATLMLFLVGAVLIFYKPAYQSLMMTTFGTATPSPLDYGATVLGFNAGTKVVLQFVQIIGFVSFVRGWIYLTQASNPGGHATFGKAITHIFGGILAINIQGTANVLKATFGVI